MQIVGYEPPAADPTTGERRQGALLLADSGAVTRRALEPGTDIAYALGDRRCAGAVEGDDHRACEAPAAPYCEGHASTWVCARCTGTCLKDEMDCYDPHAVYLAAFAPDAFKVGVTREWRLRTRLTEQGADRAAHLRTVENGRIAREIEAELAGAVTDRVRVPTKVAGLSRSVDADAWDDALAAVVPGADSPAEAVVDTYEFDYGLDLVARPVAETMATGTVRGVKGRVLVLDRGGSTYAVDARDLVGHEVEDGRTDRELQSSLTAFE